MKAKRYRVGSPGRKSSCRSVLIGVSAAVVILLLLLSMTALLIDSGTLSLNQGKTAAKIVFAASVLTGCWLSAKRSTSGKLLWSMCTAAIFSIGTGLFCFLSGEGKFAALPLLAIAAAAALIGALLGSKQRKSVL